jgi:hypothetical protein
MKGVHSGRILGENGELKTNVPQKNEKDKIIFP